MRVTVIQTMDEDFDADAGDAMDTDDELIGRAPYSPPFRNIPEQRQYVTYFCSCNAVPHQLSKPDRSLLFRRSQQVYGDVPALLALTAYS